LVFEAMDAGELVLLIELGDASSTPPAS
jgi:hypothetical protein